MKTMAFARTMGTARNPSIIIIVLRRVCKNALVGTFVGVCIPSGHGNIVSAELLESPVIESMLNVLRRSVMAALKSSCFYTPDL